MVICLERDADLHMAQLMPVPLIVSCFSKIQIGFTFPVPAHLGSPGKGPLNGCACVFSASYCLHSPSTASAVCYRRSAHTDMDMLMSAAAACCDMG